MPPEKAWKTVERTEAKKLGAKRIPVGTPGAPDASSEFLCIEVKARKRLPAWIVATVALARSKAEKGQLGIALLHEFGSWDSLVVMSRNDFIDWFGWTKGE